MRRPRLPAGSIDVPAAGSAVHRGPVVAGGWALGPDGPPEEVLVLVEGLQAHGAAVGGARPDVAEAHRGVSGAERCGWETQVDVRRVPGRRATLVLLARTGGSSWHELDRLEIDVEPPGTGASRSRAVFTIARNEPRFLPLWLRHYGRHFDPADVYVLDHDSTDGSTSGLEGACNVVPVHRGHIFDQMWIKGTVQDFQSLLLRSYETVLYAEVDELVVPDPERYAGLGAYIDALDGPGATCAGYNVVQQPGEEPLRFDEPVLAQRGHWHPSRKYSKRLLSRVPLTWNVGFHEELSEPGARPDPDLRLVHLHRVDYDYCLQRHRAAAAGDWNPEDVRFNLTWHQRVADPDEFRDWFYNGEDLDGAAPEPIPERFRRLF